HLNARVARGALHVELTGTGETEVSIVGDAEAVDSAVVEQHEDEIRIVIGEDRNLFRFSRSSATVLVRCPDHSQLALRAADAMVDVRGTAADARIKSASGVIEAEAIGGSAVLHSASGDIHAREVSGNLSVKAASGDVRIGSVGGRLVAELASGNLT